MKRANHLHFNTYFTFKCVWNFAKAHLTTVTTVHSLLTHTVMQAMDLGVPVVARDIPGNAAIVENGQTGLMYNTPEVFQSYSCVFYAN